MILLYLVFCLVPGIIASDKGRSFWGFFLLSLLLSPIIGIIFALIAIPYRKEIK